MGSSFYRNSEACVLVFDLTTEDSFKNIDQWRTEFLRMLNPPDEDEFPFILVGNKSDRENDVIITKEQIEAYCREHHNMVYFATSAMDGTNLEEAFNKVAELALDRYQRNNMEIVLPETKYLKFDKKVEKKKKCCL